MREKNSSRDAQEALYTETRAMLSKLGLEEYEKNFKKAHLSDLTLPLLTDRFYTYTLLLKLEFTMNFPFSDEF